MRATQRLMDALPFIQMFFVNFCRVGQIALSECTGDVASKDTSDQHAPIDMRRSHGIRSTRSPSTRAHFPSVDRLSDIRWPRFYRAIGEPQLNMWLLKDTSMKIGRAIIMEPWDCGQSDLCNRSRPIVLQRIRRLAFFPRIFL